jgi:hypothetical protein
MTEPEIDLMDVDRTERLGHAFHDADGTDWRLEPHDDEAVLDALRPDADPKNSEAAPTSG